MTFVVIWRYINKTEFKIELNHLNQGLFDSKKKPPAIHHHPHNLRHILYKQDY